MRIDHHAYQRATRVAGVGFLGQLGLGLTLLIFSLVGGPESPQDTPFLFGSLYTLLGLLVWVGLIVIFNQHKLERLEALEEDELAAREGGYASESVFDRSGEDLRVAARRLHLMHRWLMPGLSLVIAAGLGVMAWLMLRHLTLVGRGEAEFRLTPHVGWAVSICLGFSALSFIVSRFVAGMAKQVAWQNLRGGAAYMVGNALVTLAIAVGIGFRFFKNDEVIEAIAYAIPAFMIVLGAEIILNFVLNLYRPRVPGDTPRPAFDSKLLSLFSAPDNLVRSINEAVNYQFGFDITSSWGYQLLLRSFAWLIALGLLVMMVLNMIVIVEPHQQAVKLSRGRLVGDRVHGSGVMWKLPWPLESAEIFDVSEIRELPLTGVQVVDRNVQLWTDDLGRTFDKKLEPFIVGRSTLDRSSVEEGGRRSDREAAGAGAGEPIERISENYSLADAEIILQYRIREDGGLLDYLRFVPDTYMREYDRTIRGEALAAISLGQIGQTLATLSVDGVLADRRSAVPDLLRERIQRAFDRHRTGIELVAVDLPLLRPAGEAAGGFEELSVSYQARQQHVANARQKVAAGLAQIVGDPARVDAVRAALSEWERRRDEQGADATETLAQRRTVRALLTAAGGLAAQIISDAERDRWVRLMNTRAEASRLKGQIVSYHAAPRLYRERESMRVLGDGLAGVRKYILCVDPSRVNFDLDLKELDTMFGFGDAFEEDKGTSQ